jgi:hypothetical protein
MNHKFFVYTFLASLLPGLAHASEAEINIGDQSVNGQLTLLTSSKQAEFGAGYIYREGGVHIGNIDLHARGQTAIGNLPTTVGIGAQLSFFDENDLDGSALGLGGYAHVKIPEVPGLGIKAAVHFAPSITSFGDTDMFWRTDIKATYRVIQNADIYVGYRNVRADLNESGDHSLDENAHVGFTVMF